MQWKGVDKMEADDRWGIVVVDFQADFTEARTGALAVPGTDEDYIKRVISMTRSFKEKGLPVFATRDYHPADHISFHTSHTGKKPFEVMKTQSGTQVLWPPHCVQGTSGAEILLPAELITEVISTGDRKDFESYSGFRDDGGRETGLKRLLDERRINSLIIYGLATDYCVRSTVLHALDEKYKVKFLSALSRGITPEGINSSLEEMRVAGAEVEL